MIGWKYEVITSNIEENSTSTSPEQYVIDLSKDKANSVASQIDDKALIIAADTTEVHFKNITDNDILWYVENEKDVLSRAGYALGGKAALFADKIVGDFYNVLGLPISKLHSKLNELGYSISDFELKD